MWPVIYGVYSWLCTPLGDTITPIVSKQLGIPPDLFHQWVIATLVPMLAVCLVVIVIQTMKLRRAR